MVWVYGLLAEPSAISELFSGQYGGLLAAPVIPGATERSIFGSCVYRELSMELSLSYTVVYSSPQLTLEAKNREHLLDHIRGCFSEGVREDSALHILLTRGTYRENPYARSRIEFIRRFACIGSLCV